MHPETASETVPEVTAFDTVSEDEIRRAAVLKGQAGERPTTEIGTVVPFPGSPGDDAAFIAGVRSSGAAACRDVVARLQSTELQSTDDDDGEAAVETAPANRRRAPPPRKPVEDEDRRQYLTERELSSYAMRHANGAGTGTGTRL